MYACVHVCMCAWIVRRVHVCMYACVHVCMCACLHVCVDSGLWSIHSSVSSFSYSYSNSFMRAFLHFYIPAFIHAGIMVLKTDLVEARLFNRVNDGEVFREWVCELLEGPLHVGLRVSRLRQLLHLGKEREAGEDGNDGEEGEEGEEGEGRHVLI